MFFLAKASLDILIPDLKDKTKEDTNKDDSLNDLSVCRTICLFLLKSLQV